MENEKVLRSAMEEQQKAEDREHVANRELHEARLCNIVDTLKAGGYFRPSENVRLVFAEPGKLGSPWRTKDGKWREGMGKAVCLCETTSMLSPATDPERDAQYPRGDHFEKALLAAGYKVDIWPDYENSSADSFQVLYYIYEAF